MAELITTDKIQYWMKTEASTFVRVTEDIVFDPADDKQRYNPTYKDRLNQPEYVTGHKVSIPFEIDLLTPGALQTYLLANEDELNVETEVIRVLMFQEVMAGEPLAGTGTYEAKKATFNMNQDPIDGSAGEAVRLTGTLNMTSDGWTAGTFDPETATFTPAV